jgi:SAM-dependent methyltransferase
VSFEVPPDAYVRLVGAYSERLAVDFIEFAGVRAGQRALDVGCGPGALTAQLASRLGSDRVSAIDPSESFVGATRQRFPEADVRAGRAEALPYADDTFDVALAQLVVHFMDDPIGGLREMGRVTRPGGTVAACVWDFEKGLGPFGPFWKAALELNPTADIEADRPGTREGQLAELGEAAGLHGIESTLLTVRRTFDTFDDWWTPFTYGIGWVGAYVAGLDDEQRTALRDRCADYLPTTPFEIAGSAWTIRARPGGLPSLG